MEYELKKPWTSGTDRQKAQAGGRFDDFKPLRDPDRNFIICGFEAGKLFGFLNAIFRLHPNGVFHFFVFKPQYLFKIQQNRLFNYSGW